MELDAWERALAVNLTGRMLIARHAIPCMQRTGGGAVVHVSSTQGRRGNPRPQDAYPCAKAAILAVSKSITVQFAADGIRSNVLLPSVTESPMPACWQSDPEQKRSTAAGVPLGRVGTTRDMADAGLFLLSGQSDLITGAELVVDGGGPALP